MAGLTYAELIKLAYGGPQTEDTFRRHVEQGAEELFGWWHWHAGNVRKPHGGFSQTSNTGMVDDTFLRPPREVRVEFKGLTGKLTKGSWTKDGRKYRPGQIDTLNALRLCGVEVFVWRVGVVTLEEVLNYLRPRERPPCPWSDPAIIGPWLP
jgi:hypothetical protein